MHIFAFTRRTQTKYIHKYLVTDICGRNSGTKLLEGGNRYACTGLRFELLYPTTIRSIYATSVGIVPDIGCGYHRF